MSFNMVVDRGSIRDSKEDSDTDDDCSTDEDHSSNGHEEAGMELSVPDRPGAAYEDEEEEQQVPKWVRYLPRRLGSGTLQDGTARVSDVSEPLMSANTDTASHFAAATAANDSMLPHASSTERGSSNRFAAGSATSKAAEKTASTQRKHTVHKSRGSRPFAGCDKKAMTDIRRGRANAAELSALLKITCKMR
jgi:hypothetical protein